MMGWLAVMGVTSVGDGFRFSVFFEPDPFVDGVSLMAAVIEAAMRKDFDWVPTSSNDDFKRSESLPVVLPARARPVTRKN